MVKIDAIVRTNRRSLSITVNKSGNVIIHAPKRLSMDYIMAFVKDKEKWIERKLGEIESNKSKNQNVISGKAYLFCGKEYKKLDITGIKKIELTSNNIVIPAQYGDRKNAYIKKWYIGLCEDIVVKRVEYFANLMHLDYTKLSFMNNKTRWGSCNKNGEIKLNYRIIMLPHRTIDYVIVHELSHLVEFNHSSKFYKLVGCIMADYKQQKKLLQDYSYLLELYR